MSVLSDNAVIPRPYYRPEKPRLDNPFLHLPFLFSVCLESVSCPAYNSVIKGRLYLFEDALDVTRFIPVSRAPMSITLEPLDLLIRAEEP